MRALTINSFPRMPLLLLGAAETLVLYSSVYVAAATFYGGVAAAEQVLGPLPGKAWLLAITILVSLISMGLYHFNERVRFTEMLARMLAGFTLAFLVLAVVFYAIPSVALPRELNLVAMGYAFAFLLLLRFLFMQGVDENIFRRRTLVYGAGKRASVLGELRRKADRRGFTIVGNVPAAGDESIFDVTGMLIQNRDIDELAETLRADEIVVAMDDRRGNLPIRQLLNARLQGTEVLDIVEFLERETGKIRVDLVRPGWLIFAPGFRANRLRRASKRTNDLIAGGMIACVTWPLMLLVALAIKLEDGWRSPVLYRQQRVGLGGVSFEVLKFRSMVEDAESDGQPLWASKNDERVTRVGAVIRKFRLDELPQVFNVVRGQMSLVGPRPERPAFVAELSENVPYYSERHTVKPGMTGWAQLRYPYAATPEDAVEKLQYDLYYVKNHNLLLDFLIILQTVEVVLWGKGAR